MFGFLGAIFNEKLAFKNCKISGQQHVEFLNLHHTKSIQYSRLKFLGAVNKNIWSFYSSCLIRSESHMEMRQFFGNKDSPIRTIQFMDLSRTSRTIIHSFAMFERCEIRVMQISQLSNITVHQLFFLSFREC